jgi:hypothetical protein
VSGSEFAERVRHLQHAADLHVLRAASSRLAGRRSAPSSRLTEMRRLSPVRRIRQAVLAQLVAAVRQVDRDADVLARLEGRQRFVVGRNETDRQHVVALAVTSVTRIGRVSPGWMPAVLYISASAAISKLASEP